MMMTMMMTTMTIMIMMITQRMRDSSDCMQGKRATTPCGARHGRTYRLEEHITRVARRKSEGRDKARIQYRLLRLDKKLTLFCK